MVYVSVIFFSPSFKFNFYDIKFIYYRNTHMGQPVKRIHFIAITRTTCTIVLAASTSGGGRAAITSCHLYIYLWENTFPLSVGKLLTIIQNILSDIFPIIVVVPGYLSHHFVSMFNGFL